MGDCAKTVAHRVDSLGDCRGMAQLKSLAAMGGEVAAMVKAALDAFAHRDSAAAAGSRPWTTPSTAIAAASAGPDRR